MKQEQKIRQKIIDKHNLKPSLLMNLPYKQKRKCNCWLEIKSCFCEKDK